MGSNLMRSKDIVRKRSGGMCERCKTKLEPNYGNNPQPNSRSIHHRRPRREGGRDSVTCMVNLCHECHQWIHEFEEIARLSGWIVLGDPAVTPFEGWRGWVLPDSEGGLHILDFDAGRLLPLQPPVVRQRRVAVRPQYDRRAKTRLVSKAS